MACESLPLRGRWTGHSPGRMREPSPTKTRPGFGGALSPLIRLGFAEPPSPRGKALAFSMEQGPLPPARPRGDVGIAPYALEGVCHPAELFRMSQWVPSTPAAAAAPSESTEGRGCLRRKRGGTRSVLGTAPHPSGPLALPPSPRRGYKAPPGGRLPLRGRWHAVRRDG